MTVDPRGVWVVHGRNESARKGIFDFLRSVDLHPMEWSQAVRATGSAAPYIGDVLDKAFDQAQAVVVLFTPDEVAYLRKEYASGDGDDQVEPKGQARPNVLFEAGMAFGRHPNRTVLVELGTVRAFSDVEGRHAIRLDNTKEARKELAQRLETAGCKVDLSGSDWMTAGDLTPPQLPPIPLGRRLPGARPRGPQLDARYLTVGNGGRLQITNVGSTDLFDVEPVITEEVGEALTLWSRESLPIKRLPAGKTATLHAMAQRSLGGGLDYIEVTFRAQTADGEQFEDDIFLDLVGA